MISLVGQIAEYLNIHPKVSAAWLFGSVAAGKVKKDSDIDIAILFIPGISKFERFDLRLSLGGKVARLAGRDADVVDMEGAPLFLQHQIRKTGRLIVEKDHTYRVMFDVRSRREYFDLAPILDRRRQYLIQRVERGRPHG